MNSRLLNKTILITGASSGIGEYIAYEAASQGANLILCARRLNRLNEVRLQCEKLGSGQIIAQSLDISDPDSIDQTIEKLQSENIQVDVLINNAGFGHSEPFVNTPSSSPPT